MISAEHIVSLVNITIILTLHSHFNVLNSKHDILISSSTVNHVIYYSFLDKRFQGPRRLPVLELDSGVTLFSSNIAAGYLLPPISEDAEAVDEWLEWEATKLQVSGLIVKS